MINLGLDDKSVRICQSYLLIKSLISVSPQSNLIKLRFMVSYLGQVLKKLLCRPNVLNCLRDERG